MRERIFLAAVIICILCWRQFYAQNPNFSAYGETFGLKRQDVSCVYQDLRGVLWVGTSGSGIYQFVQSRFSQSATLPDATGYFIAQIGEDQPGFLYILSELGLMRYDGKNVLNVSGSSQKITSFAINSSGLWWATGDSLYLKTTVGIVLKKPHTSDLLISSPFDNTILLSAGPEGISAFDERVTITETITLAGSTDHQCVGYTRDTDGTLWLASENGQLLRMNAYTHTMLNSGLSNVSAIVAGALGSLWILNNKQISIYQSQDSTMISIPLQSEASCLYFDRYNRLWIGSASEGLIRYFGEQSRVWTLQDNVEQIIAGEQTYRTVLSTTSGRLVHLANASEMSLPNTKGDVTQVYRDVKSRIWALSDNRLWMQHDSSWTLMDSTGISTEAEIVGSDRLGNIWIAQEQQLMRYIIKPVAFPAIVTFASQRIAGKIPQDRTVAVFDGRINETLRIGSQSLGHITQDHYKQTHLLGFTVLSADLDSSGFLWLGTEASGIFRLRPQPGQSPRPLDSTYPLRVEDIIFIKQTDNGLLAGTNKDILRIHTDTSGLLVTKVEVLNQEAGIEFTDLNRHRFDVTGDGHLLVAAERAIVEFDLLRSDAADHAPTVFVSQVLINGTDIRDTKHQKRFGPFGKQIQIPMLSYSENNIAFVFSGVTVEDEYLYYAYRLKGYQELWSSLGTANEIQFSGLTAGQYVLEVRVCDAAGNCSEIPEQWAFVLRKALWHHACFWVAIPLILMTIGWLLYRQRTRRELSEAMHEKQRLEEELNALTLEQKNLQLQMNPHFIFNALQTLRSHIHEDKLEEVRTNLTRFAKLMRTMLEFSRSDKINLEDELEFLQAYVDVEKMSHTLPLVFHTEIGDEIEPFAIEIPPMLIQPILENAIKYGGKEHKEIHVDMDIKLQNGLLIVTIQDNGTGFGSHALHHKSASIDIISNRLARMGKGGGIEIRKAKDGGAVVEMRIPC